MSLPGVLGLDQTKIDAIVDRAAAAAGILEKSTVDNLKQAVSDEIQVALQAEQQAAAPILERMDELIALLKRVDGAKLTSTLQLGPAA